MVFSAVSIIFLLMWIIYGFDSVLENLFNHDPQTYGVGLHWSTLHALFFGMYIILVNLQVGGLHSLKQLYSEIVLDFRCMTGNKEAWDFNASRRSMAGVEFPHISALWSGFYPALMYAGFVSALALFIFEFPYVILLNWFQYGSLTYPIYQYQIGLFGISATLIRNVMLIIIPFIWCALTPKVFGYKFRYRLNKISLVLGVLCVLSFSYWVIMEPTAEYVAPEDINLILDEPITTWPKQKQFPQTIYIYLNASGIHDRNDIDGFYVKDDYVHFVNIATKYIVFIGVCYIMAVKVERKH